MKRRFVAVAAVLAVMLSASCDKKPDATKPIASSTASAVAPVTAPALPEAAPVLQKACYELAKQQCNKLWSCAELPFALHEGTTQSCLNRMRNVCMYERAPKEGGITLAALETCAKAYQAASCGDARAGHLAGCARAPGKISDGKACVFDAECASQLCTRAASESCGKCEAAPKDGEDCKQGRCGGDLACIEQKCAKRAAKGEACKGHGGCDANLVCLAGKCTTPAKAGEKCDPEGKAAAECDVFAGLFCDKTARMCRVFAIAKAGEACGEKASCSADMTCQEDKCTPLIAIHAPCNERGAMCDAPSVCVAGTCKVPEVASCPK